MNFAVSSKIFRTEMNVVLCKYYLDLALETHHLPIIFKVLDYTITESKRQSELFRGIDKSYYTVSLWKKRCLHICEIINKNDKNIIDDFRKIVFSSEYRSILAAFCQNKNDFIYRRILEEIYVKRAFQLRLNRDVVGVIYEYL